MSGTSGFFIKPHIRHLTCSELVSWKSTHNDRTPLFVKVAEVNNGCPEVQLRCEACKSCIGFAVTFSADPADDTSKPCVHPIYGTTCGYKRYDSIHLPENAPYYHPYVAPKE